MSNDARTLDRVKGVVGTVFRTDVSGLTEATRFVEDLRGKSMNTIELAAMLENEFGIPVSSAVIRKSRTVGQATELVDRLLASQDPA